MPASTKGKPVKPSCHARSFEQASFGPHFEDGSAHFNAAYCRRTGASGSVGRYQNAQ